MYYSHCRWWVGVSTFLQGLGSYFLWEFIVRLLFQRCSRHQPSIWLLVWSLLSRTIRILLHWWLGHAYNEYSWQKHRYWALPNRLLVPPSHIAWWHTQTRPFSNERHRLLSTSFWTWPLGDWLITWFCCPYWFSLFRAEGVAILHRLSEFLLSSYFTLLAHRNKWLSASLPQHVCYLWGSCLYELKNEF